MVGIQHMVGGTTHAIVGPCIYILVKNKKSTDQTHEAYCSSIHVTSRGGLYKYVDPSPNVTSMFSTMLR